MNPVVLALLSSIFAGGGGTAAGGLSLGAGGLAMNPAIADEMSAINQRGLLSSLAGTGSKMAEIPQLPGFPAIAEAPSIASGSRGMQEGMGTNPLDWYRQAKQRRGLLTGGW